VRRRPYSVILLDEIEKAHNEVFDVLLQILDDGRLTDGQGRTVDFRNTVLIMTSNLRSQEEMREFFRPEFLNRIDEIVEFEPLTKDQLEEIIELQLERLRVRLAERGIKLELTDEAKHVLAEAGWDPTYGARPLKRAIQRLIENPLALRLLAGDFGEGRRIEDNKGVRVGLEDWATGRIHWSVDGRYNQIAQGPFVVVANPQLRAKTIADVIALAKASPGEINYASSGQGSIPHLATELLASMAGVKFTHVPYRGGGPALTDTIGGRVSLFLSPTSTALPHIKAGTLHALAVTTATRSPALPDVPTVAASGVPGYDVVLWHGIIGPRNLPAPIVARLNREVNAILGLNEAVTLLARDGVAPAGGPPERLQALVANETVQWRKVVEQAGIKAE